MLQTPQPNQLWQSQWASELNALLAKPLSQGSLIGPFTLSVGNNVLNTRLGRSLQGWVVARVLGAPTALYEVSSDTSTLTLNSSAIATISLIVF